MAVIKKGQPCSDLCSCIECGNEYGHRDKRSDPEPTQRRRKITSSPPSLKRARTTTFLQRSGIWAVDIKRNLSVGHCGVVSLRSKYARNRKKHCIFI